MNDSPLPPDAPADFAALAARAADGDEVALNDLARLYEAKVRIVARAMLGPALRPYLDSVDLVQAVHASVLAGVREQRLDVSDPEKLTALAVSIVRRKVARQWRRAQRQRRLSGHHNDHASTPDGLLGVLGSVGNMGTDPARIARFREQLSHVYGTITEAERQMLDLRLQGHSTAEMAAQLQLNPIALRVRLTRLRQRLEAEAVRDAMLAVGGRLDLTMGGPGFRAFGFTEDHSPRYEYEEADPDDPRALRRSVYRFVVRSVPDPLMEALDCADPSQAVPKRNETLTALQALALLNNRLGLRAAEHLAERVRPVGKTDAERVAAAYRLALGRMPTDDERRTLTDVAVKHGLPNACRIIFNLNEFVFVD